MDFPIVSIIAPIRNEAEFLADFLDDINLQEYPHEKIEVILINNRSTDQSGIILESWVKKSAMNFFYITLLVGNSSFLQDTNKGMMISHGTYILRFDTHARYAPNYISCVVRRLQAGADVCGGNVEFRCIKIGTWSRMLYNIETSRFGCGASPFRQNRGQEEVQSVFHPSYSRRILNKVGLLDERMFRCEDNELHQRILREGGHIWLDPSIHSTHYIRTNYRCMLRQKYQNGQGVANLLFYCRDALCACYLVPLLFVIALFVSAILAVSGFLLLLTLIVVAYACTSIFFSVKSKSRLWFLMPFIFFTLHVAYGVGTFIGIVHNCCFMKKQSEIKYFPKEESMV